MVAIAIILGLISFGMLCRAMFALAVHALPFFVGVSLGCAMLQADCDVGRASLAGVVAAVMTAAVGRLLLTCAPSPALRLVVASAFLVPAVMAGYHVVFGLAGLATPSTLARAVAACVGAVLVGVTAWRKFGCNGARLATMRRSHEQTLPD